MAPRILIGVTLDQVRLELIKASLPGRCGTIASRTGISQNTVERLIKILHENGECRIGGWVQLANGFYVPRYVPGPGEDATAYFLAPMSVLRDPQRLALYKTPPTFDVVVFDHLPGTSVLVRQKSGLGENTVLSWLDKLHKDGKIHIKRWTRHKTNNAFLPVYHRGPGEDAICKLKPLSKEEKNARARHRKKRKRILEIMEQRKAAADAERQRIKAAKVLAKEQKDYDLQQKRKAIADGTWSLMEENRKAREAAQRNVEWALNEGMEILNLFYNIRRRAGSANDALSTAA